MFFSGYAARMQSRLFSHPAASLLRVVHSRLPDASAGFTKNPARLSPPDQLVRAMLGARTQDAVSLQAFWRLKRRYADWSQLAAADYREVLERIAGVTFAEDKAANLQAAMARLDLSRGGRALDFLAEWPVDSALAWLESLPGVGRKTSAAVLNFSTLQRPAMVIDSHHQRVAKRLGLARWRASVEDTYNVLMASAPGDWAAADFERHHHNIKAHGQKLCHHLAPDCRGCPLADICPSAA